MSARRGLLALLALVACAGGLLAWRVLRPPLSVYRVFESPDGAYRVVVLAERALVPMMPGHGGDAPGVVRLVDREGRVLRQAPVEMVQTVTDVSWSGRRVDVRLFAEWELPPAGSPAGGTASPPASR